jgi:hypothetical protein
MIKDKKNSDLCRHYVKVMKGTWKERGLCKGCIEYIQDVMDEQNRQKMSLVLDRDYGEKDTDKDILAVINRLAKNRTVHVLNDGENVEWERTKLKEIERLSGILIDRWDKGRK